MSKPVTEPVRRLSYTREEAATSLGMSLRSFEEHVQPNLSLIYVGRKRLVPIRELERWVTEQARLTA